MRILLFTGKGGVGKTTIAAATAVASAAAGHRTAIMSTDPAHSLGDAFGVDLGDEWTELAPGLVGRELNAQRRLDEQWVEIRDYLLAVFDWAGLAAVEAEELAIVPGLDEVFALGDIQDIADRDEVDVLVVDCAPTAETLRLLSLPDVVTRAMETVFPVGRRLNKVLGPLVSRLSDAPRLPDGVFDATERVGRRLEGVRNLLSDGARTSVRLVLNPERMVIAETQRTFTYLCLYGVPVDAVIVNRVLPREAATGWTASWYATQEQRLAEIDAAFDPPRVLTGPMAQDEVTGREALRALAEAIYGDTDPVEPITPTVPLRLETGERGQPVLLVELPFASRGDVDVVAVGSDLMLTIGSHRRAVRLPDSLATATIRSARLADSTLRIEFESPR